MSEFPVRLFPEIDTVQNVGVSAIRAVGDEVDVNAENPCEDGVPFHLIGNRIGDPSCLRLALPRRAVV
jgi:hypothetical protein